MIPKDASAPTATPRFFEGKKRQSIPKDFGYSVMPGVTAALPFVCVVKSAAAKAALESGRPSVPVGWLKTPETERSGEADVRRHANEVLVSEPTQFHVL